MIVRQLSLVVTGLLMISGCSDNPVIRDSDEQFTISLSAANAFAEREGISVAETTDGVFSCRGSSQDATPLQQNAYFPAAPNHTLILLETISGLTVRVVSDDEFVLWVRGETGSFCNTGQGDSVFRGSWSAGEYDIFIGSPAPDAEIEYTLLIE
jgi:hypothetical protein